MVAFWKIYSSDPANLSQEEQGYYDYKSQVNNNKRIWKEPSMIKLVQVEFGYLESLIFCLTKKHIVGDHILLPPLKIIQFDAFVNWMQL
jgi:hypothetical protein